MSSSASSAPAPSEGGDPELAYFVPPTIGEEDLSPEESGQELYEFLCDLKTRSVLPAKQMCVLQAIGPVRAFLAALRPGHWHEDRRDDRLLRSGHARPQETRRQSISRACRDGASS
eukprot:4549619-Alexandrium_andersonii.AAC.1